MSQQEAISTRNWTIIIIVVLGIIVFCTVAFLLYQELGQQPAMNEFEREAIQERLKPMGQISISAEQPEAQQVAQAQPTQEAEPQTGQEVYNSVCMACHATGVSNAPKFGDQAAWQERYAKGQETLMNSVVNGLNAMPPRGGNPDLSDEELKRAIDYMLAEAGIETSSAAAPAEKTETAESEQVAPAAKTPPETNTDTVEAPNHDGSDEDQGQAETSPETSTDTVEAPSSEGSTEDTPAVNKPAQDTSDSSKPAADTAATQPSTAKTATPETTTTP
ncbi:MAG: c-type cytochrome [Pseudomonadota bacterium]|nr:c-type cytochrome [Pseudomonadota bacterium]